MEKMQTLSGFKFSELIKLEDGRAKRNLLKVIERQRRWKLGELLLGPLDTPDHHLKGEAEEIQVIARIDDSNLSFINNREDETIYTKALDLPPGGYVFKNANPLFKGAVLILVVNSHEDQAHIKKVINSEHKESVLQNCQFSPSVEFFKICDRFASQNPQLVVGQNKTYGASIKGQHGQAAEIQGPREFTHTFSIEEFKNNISPYILENNIPSVIRFLGGGRIGVVAIDPLGQKNPYRHKDLKKLNSHLPDLLSIPENLTFEDNFKYQLFIAIDTGMFELVGRQPVCKDFAVKYLLETLFESSVYDNNTSKLKILQIFNKMFGLQIAPKVCFYDTKSFISTLVEKSSTAKALLHYYDQVSIELTPGLLDQVTSK